VPTASNLDDVKDEDVPNAVDVKVAPGGTVCLFTLAATHLVADIAGYFTEQSDIVYQPQL
jgi:hypothetical protein